MRASPAAATRNRLVPAEQAVASLAEGQMSCGAGYAVLALRAASRWARNDERNKLGSLCQLAPRTSRE